MYVQYCTAPVTLTTRNDESCRPESGLCHRIALKDHHKNCRVREKDATREKVPVLQLGAARIGPAWLQAVDAREKCEVLSAAVREARLPEKAVPKVPDTTPVVVWLAVLAMEIVISRDCYSAPNVRGGKKVSTWVRCSTVLYTTLPYSTDEVCRLGEFSPRSSALEWLGLGLAHHRH